MRGAQTLLLGLALGLALSTCSRPEPIRIAISAWAGVEVAELAARLGLYEKHGVPVQMVRFSAYSDSLAALRDGKVQAGMHTLDDVIRQAASGKDVRAILATDASFGGDGLVARVVGISATLLKLANSSFFGFFQNVTSPRRAVTLRGKPLVEAERSLVGSSHAEIGAFLLGLWGVSENVVEAVFDHHSLGRSGLSGFFPAVAVHVADRLEHEQAGEADAGLHPPLDTAWLEGQGLAERLTVWIEACKETAGEASI
jgi:hypothetical protein